MKVNAVKTKKIVKGDKLFDVLNQSITSLPDNSVVAVSSKIISICEGRIVKIGEKDKDSLVREEAEFYLSPEHSKYGFILSIKHNVLIPSAGIDESNANGHYVLWPGNPQKAANDVRAYLRKKFKLKNLGIIITDSKTSPLRWGVTGVSIAHSGFSALNDYIGKKDIFGRIFKVEKSNIADALAVSAVAVMGEGAEQTPIAVIEDVPFVKFQDRNPTSKELEELHIKLEDDLYAPLLEKVKWKKGKRK